MEGSARQHHRLRCLAAMGIDVYRRRALAPLAAPAPRDAAGPSASPLVPPAAAGTPAPDRDASGAPLDLARAVLEAPVDTPAPPPGAGAPEPSEPGRPSADASVPDVLPRFRLVALRCGTGLLLVDEVLLPDPRRAVLARLGDLLRAGMLLRGTATGAGAAARGMETQAFFWPQVEAAHVDQSLPRAVEALCAWVRRCTRDGEGFLVVVAPPEASPARAPLEALESLPVRRARIDAAFVSAPGAEAHRAAWEALAGLADAGTGAMA